MRKGGPVRGEGVPGDLERELGSLAESRMAGNAAEHARLDDSRQTERAEGGDTAQQRVERPQALDVGVHVDAAVPGEHVVADDVRPRRGIGGELERRSFDPERSEVVVVPEPVLPARVVRLPARAEGLLLLRQRPGPEPDPVHDPRDAASPKSPRERSRQRSLGLAAGDDLELGARADAQPAHVLVHEVELELVAPGQVGRDHGQWCERGGTRLE